MDHKFVNARSPLRLLEKGLHGGLGSGNLGLVIAGPGVGKTPFLVGVALDELLRGGTILHVSLDESVQHVRTHFDAVFDELAETTHLDDPAGTHQAIDRRRSIRSYPKNTFSGSTLREAVKFEGEAGHQPGLIVLEGLEFDAAARDTLGDVRALAQELGCEIWLSAGAPSEQVSSLPGPVDAVTDLLSVILTLEPHESDVRLRAIKDHDNADLADLHVALDPRTLLLKRS